jgi:hypothetical protein
LSAWRFFKWPKLNVWHVDRDDGRSYCGLLIDPNVERLAGNSPPGTLCRICKTQRRQQTQLPGVRR